MTDTRSHLTTALADRYRLERELGAGGMANVYLAYDLRHDRKVAIKVLKAELAVVIGAERFLREIKTIATLQHPHILGLIDSGEVNGTAYYVMPFVEGESLRDRLNREKQLPINDAIRIATEAASALDYAHRHGVIHRDIKPENIMLHDGSALVADFGIALAVSSAGASSRMTETGMSLGTPHYMSPEQAMGERDITARSDIYALGCVLYEMLTAEPPFEGATAQAIVARVLTESPRSLRPQRKSVPPHVEAAVLTALEKLPADRFESAKAFAEALADPAYSGTSSSSTRAIPSYVAAESRARSRRRRAATTIALVSAATGLAAGWVVWHQRPAEVPPTVLRYTMVLPESLTLTDAVGTPVAYSRDGSVFAYTSRAGLMLRYTDRLDAMAVPGGRRGAGPFFSPDGRWLGFQMGAGLIKVPLAGGAPVTICDSCAGFAFTWGSDDTVRYHTAPPDNGASRVLMAVSAQGGRPQEFARPDSASGEAFRTPILLPGRRTVLFSIFKGAASTLAAMDLRTRAITRFDQPGFGPQWVDAGFVALGNRDGTLIALPFDAEKARPTGPPVTIAHDVSQPDAFSSRAAVSATGSIVYPRSGGGAPRRLMLVSRSGQATPLTPDLKGYANPRFSPDGRRVVVYIADPIMSSRDVWVLDVGQRVWSRLTTNGISDKPIWTPDGRRVVYSSNDDLWWIAADGSGRPESLLVSAGAHFAGSVTPDGRAVVFQETGSISGIRTLVFDSAPAARTVIPAAFNESAPALSADGHWLAYQSDQTGQMEVYVRSYPEPGARVPVSLQGGTEPVWAHNGKELFYRAGDSLMVASVALSPALSIAGRRLLFTSSLLSGGGQFREYDVAPDDQHFVMISSGAAQSTLIGVQNVFQRLLYERRTQR
jgi:serine/threonine-protein kinase